MPHLELRHEHYVLIRNFMEDFIPESPKDALTPAETETLDLVRQIIFNIEKRRASPPVKHHYRRQRVRT
jgi:hypothetical protein